MPNRPIDRHEDAILAVLEHCDEGWDLGGACERVSRSGKLTSDRLKHCQRDDTREPGVWFDGYEAES